MIAASPKAQTVPHRWVEGPWISVVLMQRMSDVDDHHATLGLLARRRDDGALTSVAAMPVYRNFGPTTLALAALLLLLLEDFFDDPGIQHGGPPFRLILRANWSNTRLSYR